MTTDQRGVLRRAVGKLAWWYGIRDELSYWNKWLATKGLEWPDDYRVRMDPEAPLTNLRIIEPMRRISRERIEILDVGAGPLTIVGKTFPGKRIEIVPIDPLARLYTRLLRKHGVVPPVRTMRGDAEKLNRLFPERRFDLAYARNCLDHGHDPLRSIRLMLQTVRDDGAVVLQHKRNEAETAAFKGLHKWNFDVRNGDLVVWNRFVEENVSKTFEGLASVEVEDDESWIHCTIQRLRRGGEVHTSP